MIFLKMLKSLVAVALLFSADISISYAVNPSIDVSPLVGDYVASNSGIEVIIPHFIDNKSNEYGTNDHDFSIYFDVYEAGTMTKVFSTVAAHYKISSGGDSFYSSDLNPFSYYGVYNDYIRSSTTFKRIGTTIILIERIDGLSGDNTPSFIYGVDVSAAGKKPWSKLLKDVAAGVGTLPDMNANKSDELIVFLPANRKSAYMGSRDYDATPYIFDGKTGAVLIKPQTYPVAGQDK